MKAEKLMIRILLALALCLSFHQADSKIIETSHLEDVLPLIDDETWLLVDLDNCFFEARQALGHANWFYDEVDRRMQQGMSKENAIRDFYPNWIKTQKICRVKPIEDDFVPRLKALQNRGIVIMGLTHRQPLIVDSTLRQVASLGFDFSQTAPYEKKLFFEADNPSVYVQGILFVGDYNKKLDLFETYLNKIGKTPRKVVFLDDKRKNVEELESLTARGIDYTGVHYTAIEHAKPVYFREIALFQYKILEQIISNESAQMLKVNHLD